MSSKRDPLAKLATLDLVAHLKARPTDWPRGYVILSGRWPGQFQNLTDFERQMNQAINLGRAAVAGRSDIGLLPVAVSDMTEGRVYLVRGGGQVWLARHPLPLETASVSVYLILLP